jgi:translation initiation factor 3 subunit D
MAKAFAPIDFDHNEFGWGPTSAPELFTDVYVHSRILKPSAHRHHGTSCFKPPRFFPAPPSRLATSFCSQYPVRAALDRPYTSFSKSDKLGKAADWTYTQRQKMWNKQPAEDGDFTVVDNKQQYKQKQFGPRFRGRRRQYEKDTGPERNSNQRPQRSRREREFEARRASNTHWKRNDQPEVVKETSVEVKPSWEMIEQLDLKAMTKLRVSAANVPAPEDVKWAGSLNHYDRTYDRVTSRTPQKLQSFEHLTFHSVTTTDDPVIRKETRGECNVFATDAVLASIACAPRSVYSWDLVFHRIGNKLFIDKREDSAFDFLTVNETSHDPPSTETPEDINSAQSLSQEATAINQNFSQQIMQGEDGKTHDCAEPNPFKGAKEQVPSVAYRYRKWTFGDDVGINMLVRCSLDGVVTPKQEGEEKQFMTCMALNEFDPKVTGVDWRRKLETQRGAVLANELKNNSNKLGRWTAASFLAGADLMQLGFVSRKNPTKKWEHEVLAAPVYKPREFARQINLNPDNMWGILQYIIKMVLALPTGSKYVLLKDPNKKMLLLYKVPLDTFDDSESSSEEEDDDDDEEESDDEEDEE